MLVSAGAVDNWHHAVRGLQQRCLVVKLDAAPFPLLLLPTGIEKGMLRRMPGISHGGSSGLLWRERTNEMSDEMVEMGSCAYLEHVGDGLESSVRVVGEPRRSRNCAEFGQPID